MTQSQTLQQLAAAIEQLTKLELTGDLPANASTAKVLVNASVALDGLAQRLIDKF